MATPADVPVRLSVIIPAHQAAAVLAQQLDAVLGQGGGDDWEVVVVDNRSTDGTRALVERYVAEHPRLRYVAAHDQANASYARNAGAAAARGRALAFVDADDVVAPGWLEAMDAALLRHELVSGPLHYDLLNPAWAVQVRGAAQRDGFFYIDGGPPWPLLFAANLGVRKDRHDEIGGFDERLPWGGEDADYGWRLQALGLVPHWAPDAVVQYRVRDRLRPLFRQAVGYGRSFWVLHARYADHWPSPPTAPSRRRLVARAVRRLPSLRSRAGRVWYAFALGWDIGDRSGARLTGTPVGPRRTTGAAARFVEPDLDDDGQRSAGTAGR